MTILCQAQTAMKREKNAKIFNKKSRKHSGFKYYHTIQLAV
jgi:hypothetical protein